MHFDGKLPKFKAPLVKQLKKGTEIQLVLPNLGTPAGLWGPGKGQGAPHRAGLRARLGRAHELGAGRPRREMFRARRGACPQAGLGVQLRVRPATRPPVWLPRAT